MFTLQDGREHLYQWDLNRYIIVNDPTICEVHFCNRTAEYSLVVEVKDGLAAIPNILLQESRPIRVYAYCDDQYTLTEQQLTVKSRTRPSDYVYEETEVVRVDVLLDKAEEAITNALELTEYFDTHKLEVKDDGQGNVTLEAIVPEGGGGDVDLSNYYNKAETDARIEEAIEGIEIPEVDLTPYATQQFVLDKVAEIDIPEGTSTDTYFLDATVIEWDSFKQAICPENLIPFVERVLNGETLSLYIKNGEYWQPARYRVYNEYNIWIHRTPTWEDFEGNEITVEQIRRL